MTDRWLAISYKVPVEPSRKRVYVWRKLKERGAVYLQQGVGVLPDTPEIMSFLQQLRGEVIEMEGEAAVVALSFVNDDDRDRVMGEFEALRNQEYDEIIEQCERLIDEIERETETGKFNYAEIEENEEELTKINRWMARVIARDYFGASGRAGAEGMIEQAAQKNTAYTDEVYRREGR